MGNIVPIMPINNPSAYNKTGFKRSIAIQQTGATRIGKNRYQLGGAIFSGKQLARGRAQYGMVKFNLPKQTAYKSVGLKLPKI